MQLLAEILGALVAGALVVVVLRQLDAEPARAFGAVALVAVSVAAVLAVPNLRSSVAALLAQRSEYAGLTSAEAQVKGGADLGVDVAFLAWVREHLGEGETFHLEIGRVPGEAEFEGGGVQQATIFAWATFQLAPHLLVEQSPSAHDVASGEGRNADWIVFYGMSPKKYPAKHLGKVLTYAPNFAIARTRLAG